MSGGGSVTAKLYGHCQELLLTALRELMSGKDTVTAKSYGDWQELDDAGSLIERDKCHLQQFWF